MGLGLLLIPSLGGYWFLQHANFTRYEIHRQSGYHLLFRAALVGIVLAASAHTIALIITRIAPLWHAKWHSVVAVDYIDTAILSIVLSRVLPPVINVFDSQEKAAKRSAQRYGDLMELIIFDSIERQMMVELSLQNGKSYIGYAIESSITKPSACDVALTPVASGYRSTETHELHITTHYSPVIQKWRGDEASEDDVIRAFRIVISRNEVCSARLFDPAVYLMFRQ